MAVLLSIDWEPAQPSSFAERLEELFARVLNAGGRRYTLEEFSQRAADLGHSISPTCLSHLRTGRAKYPTFQTAEAIAATFGVDIQYILSTPLSDRNQAELDYHRFHADPNLRAIASGLTGLDCGDIQVIADMIGSIRKRRGLPFDLPAPPRATQAESV